MASFADALAAGYAPRLRRSVIDEVTGQPVVTSPPTGEIATRSALLPIGVTDGGRLAPAVPGFVGSALEAARLPGQVYRGEVSIFDPASGRVSDEAIGRATDLAGLAMTGSMPFKAPAGALRSFGGAAAKSDPLAELEAALSSATSAIKPDRPHTFVDPSAQRWDLYHGTAAPNDFGRFRVDLPHVQGQTNAAPGEAGALFLSPAAKEASYYAGDVAGRNGYTGPAGPRVIRATVDPGKTDVFDLPQMVMNDPDFVARARKSYLADNGDSFFNRDMFDHHIDRTRGSLREHADTQQQIRDLGYPVQPATVPYAYGITSAAVQMAKERGLDTAVIRGLSESNGGDQVIALTPGRVRSYYDPSQVLFSTGPAAVGIGAAGAAMIAGGGDAQAAPASFSDALASSYKNRR